MLYVCGLLFSEAKLIRNLQIEIPRGDMDLMGEVDECPFWTTTGHTGMAETLNFKASSDSKSEFLDFLLKPLALPGRVGSCEFVVSEDFQHHMTPHLRNTMDRYKEALVDQKAFRYEETRWLWDQYVVILDRKEEIRREQRKALKDEHEAWMLSTHKIYICMHQRRGKRYYRDGGKKAKCNGCGRWRLWLLDCLKCRLRACKDFVDELKEKRSELDLLVQWEEWNRTE